MATESDQDYPSLPEHEINADNFIQRVQSVLASKYPDVELEAVNFSKHALQKDLSEAEDPFSDEEYEDLSGALQKIDSTTPDFYLTNVCLRHDDIDLVTRVAREIDAIAKELKGTLTEDGKAIGREIDSDLPEFWVDMWHKFKST